MSGYPVSVALGPRAQRAAEQHAVKSLIAHAQGRGWVPTRVRAEGEVIWARDTGIPVEHIAALGAENGGVFTVGFVCVAHPERTGWVAFVFGNEPENVIADESGRMDGTVGFDAAACVSAFLARALERAL